MFDSLWAGVGSATDWMHNAVTGRLTDAQIAAIAADNGLTGADAQYISEQEALLRGYVNNYAGGTAEDFEKSTLLPALFGGSAVVLVLVGVGVYFAWKAKVI